MEPIHVILNPNAGGGRGLRIRPALERAMGSAGIPFSIAITREPGHARELARGEFGRSPSRLLVVGGDGTVHEVVGGLLEGGRRAVDLPSLAVLPVGTGNDFHRLLRAPAGVDATVRVLQEGIPRTFEVGLATWEGGSRHFINLVGVGIDVEVLRCRATYARLPGVLQYLGALASALRRYRPLPVEVTCFEEDGERRVIEAEVLLSAVTVGPSIGGGFLLSPAALPDDGLLDLFLVEKLGIFKVARYLPGILRGTLAERPEIRQAKVTRVVIRPRDGRKLAFELDGELMPLETPVLDIRVQPDSLRFLEMGNGELRNPKPAKGGKRVDRG